MMYPGTASSGYSMGSSDSSDLEERKRQLVQKLMQSGARNQSGLQGLHAMPLFGGRGRGSSDLPNAALPAISFNPFLAMAAGRPNEQFQAPNGVTAQALAQAQAGMRGAIGAPAPQDVQGLNPAGQDPAAQAAASFLGQGAGATPGLDGPGAVTDPNTQFLVSGAAPRHLAGNGPNMPQLLPQGWAARFGSLIAT